MLQWLQEVLAPIVLIVSFGGALTAVVYHFATIRAQVQHNREDIEPLEQAVADHEKRLTRLEEHSSQGTNVTSLHGN